MRWVAGLRQDAIKVLFNLPYRCDFGQNLAIVGSEHQLGAWDVTKGVALRWSDGDVWQGEIEMDSRWVLVASHDGSGVRPAIATPAALEPRIPAQGCAHANGVQICGAGL